MTSLSVPFSTFFRDGETSFGIFYPTGCVLSVFRDRATAERADAALRDAGFTAGSVLLADGPAVIEYARALRADPGALARFERFVSALYTDDAASAEALVALAGQGHVFVAAYAPDDARTARAADALRPLGPVVLRKFDPLTVTDLA